MNTGLNKNQSTAINHGAGPMLVLAGPGSGKTLVITKRIQTLIEQHKICPQHILVITFTRAAAAEMKQRFFQCAQNQYEVNFGTFHAVFYHILKQTYPNRNYSIQKKEGNLLEGEIKLSDITPLCKEVLKEKENLRRWQEKFTYILIDEAQDMSTEQFDIIKQLAGREKNLFFVGDDDQSIYGFRGAGGDILKNIQEEYPSLIKVILGINYRSRAAIVKAAELVISENKNRFSKNMQAQKIGGERIKLLTFSGWQEEQCYLKEIFKKQCLIGKASENAVIFRTNRELLAFAEALRREGISFQMKEKGELIWEHKIGLDIMAVLKFAHGERTRQHLYRFLNKLIGYMNREEFREEWVAVGILGEKMEDDLKKISGMEPYAAIQYFRKKMGYDRWLAENSAEIYIADLLMKSATHHKTLDSLQGELRKVPKQEGVILVTVHGSKGLEYENVYIPQVNEGNFPHKRGGTVPEIEEERRIFYVGMTRAKERLCITCQKETASRFLKPLLSRRCI